MGLREEKRTATREQIISTAISLFTKQGYETTTIDDITKAAKVAKGTFYYHFECKEELVLALGETAMLENALRTQIAIETGQSPLIALQDFLAEAARWLTENRKLANIFFHYSISNYQHMKKHHERHDHPSFRQVVHKFLATAQEKGELRNDISSYELSQIFGLVFIHSVRYWLESSENISLKEKLNFCLSLFLEGAKPSLDFSLAKGVPPYEQCKSSSN
ncbi:MAG: TetR/AcrR family transcriptional regulator [Blastocatellia bacterium]|nr:TetR/AcrR family transcriptional regulator [Blastocatellia bacterium]MBN8725376.1 TetR/AcrR family transcriptional regulator [Acidobacteriota bacterium]